MKFSNFSEVLFQRSSVPNVGTKGVLEIDQLGAQILLDLVFRNGHGFIPANIRLFFFDLDFASVATAISIDLLLTSRYRKPVRLSFLGWR